MRTTFSIPDEYYLKIEEKFKGEGFMTINDFLLNLIRKDLGGDVTMGPTWPKFTTGHSRNSERESMGYPSTGPIVGDGTEEPVKIVGPLSPQGKAINKFKKRIPLSKEMEEKILSHGEIGSPRGELDIDNYT